MYTAKIENIEIECTQIFFPKNIKPNEAENSIYVHMCTKKFECVVCEKLGIICTMYYNICKENIHNFLLIGISTSILNLTYLILKFIFFLQMLSL